MQDDDAVTGGGCIRKEGTDNDNDNNKKKGIRVPNEVHIPYYDSAGEREHKIGVGGQSQSTSIPIRPVAMLVQTGLSGFDHFLISEHRS